MDNDNCCAKQSCCNVEQQNTEKKTETKQPTTCCGCPNCGCGDNCTCPSGTISCDPCLEFVENKKKENK